MDDERRARRLATRPGWHDVLGVAALVALAALTVGCTSYDEADRRLARPDEYALGGQRCSFEGGRALASGDLINYSGRTTGFGVIVRFLDGEVDVGRPQTVEHPDALADGDSWEWEVGLEVDGSPRDLRCNVIQVVIGDAVSG